MAETHTTPTAAEKGETVVSETDRTIMGSPFAAEMALAKRAKEWRALRQPTMATAAQHKRHDAREAEARFQLANAALLWLWHRENPQ